MSGIMTLLIAILGAIIWSLVYYAGRWATSDPATPINYAEFLSTLIVGGAVGLFFWLSDSPITMEGIQSQLVSYAAVIGFITVLLQTILKKLNVDAKALGVKLHKN